MPRISTIILSVCLKHADFFRALVLPKPKPVFFPPSPFLSPLLDSLP